MCVPTWNVNSFGEAAEAKDDEEEGAHVDIQLESTTDVLFRGQLNRFSAEYHLSVEYQPLQADTTSRRSNN